MAEAIRPRDSKAFSRSIVLDILNAMIEERETYVLIDPEHTCSFTAMSDGRKVRDLFRIPKAVYPELVRFLQVRCHLRVGIHPREITGIFKEKIMGKEWSFSMKFQLRNIPELMEVFIRKL